jgi:hypothetical protein
MGRPAGTSAQVSFSGPFFQKDPAKTLAANIRDLLEETVGLMAADVRQQVEAGEGRRSAIRAIGPNARVSQYIRGRVASLSGKPWHYYGVISPDRSGLDAKQATALYAAASEVERRTHAFNRTSRATKRQKTDLTKGLA